MENLDIDYSSVEALNLARKLDNKYWLDYIMEIDPEKAPHFKYHHYLILRLNKYESKRQVEGETP